MIMIYTPEYKSMERNKQKYTKYKNIHYDKFALS